MPTLREIAQQFVDDQDEPDRPGAVDVEGLNAAAAADGSSLGNAILMAVTRWENAESSVADLRDVVRGLL